MGGKRPRTAANSYDLKPKIFTLFQRYLLFGFIYFLFHIDVRFLEIQCKIFFDRIFRCCCRDRFFLFTLMVCIFVYSIFSDLQFPIDLSNVAKDHPFLENDPLQSLYRRLVALNRCATMRLDSAHKHGTNVSIPYIHMKKTKKSPENDSLNTALIENQSIPLNRISLPNK